MAVTFQPDYRRLLKAVNHEEPDRVPLADFQAGVERHRSLAGTSEADVLKLIPQPLLVHHADHLDNPIRSECCDPFVVPAAEKQVRREQHHLDIDGPAAMPSAHTNQREKTRDTQLLQF